MNAHRRGTVTLVLGTTQTLAWASSYYLPGVLAEPMAQDLGLPVALVFAAFSAALIVSAFLGPRAGRLIDQHGGRPVLLGTNIAFAVSLGLLALAQGPVTLFLAWALLGSAMAAGLYDSAFATLVRLYGRDARSLITGITLIAGFASTVGWPLSALLAETWGWRGACATWALLHLVVGLPLNALLPRHGPAGTATVAPAATLPTAAEPPPPRHPVAAGILLATVFAIGWCTSTALAAHLPRLLQAMGLSLGAALALGMLIGPAQVAARVAEFGLLRHVHPLLSARLAALAHPLGVLVLMLFGTPLAALFVVLHGAGNGIQTITKGTLPLAIFGPTGYGARQGWLVAPSRVTQALAPLLFGLAIDAWGGGALWISAGLGVLSFIALQGLRRCM